MALRKRRMRTREPINIVTTNFSQLERPRGVTTDISQLERADGSDKKRRPRGSISIVITDFSQLRGGGV